MRPSVMPPVKPILARFAGTQPVALWFGVIGLATGLLVVLAVRAGMTVPDASLPLVALDVIVGMAFVAAAWFAAGPVIERVLVLGVGLSWLLGSALPSAGSLHQALLVLALVASPSGRIGGPIPLLLAAAAIPSRSGLCPSSASRVCSPSSPDLRSSRDGRGLGGASIRLWPPPA